MRIFPRNFASLAIGILFISFTTFASAATLLPPDEVEALNEIGKILGKTDWNFSVGAESADPCTYSTKNFDLDKFGFEDSVTCTPCNDTSIESTGSSGHAPTRVDETHSPPRYGMNFDICRSLEFNQLSGPIPPELGSLHLLENLVIVGSGLDGPIPPGFGLLTKLSDLRISDLNGSQASFPPLNNLTRLETLFLRSCNINGTLPEYLGTMTNLTLLDLSFNNLSGKIPSNFSSLSKIEKMYLTGNLLSGPVPPWMLQSTSKSM
ncbi:hypothetical protein C3L33_13083, partial [Rhododendron williamsianum]